MIQDTLYIGVPYCLEIENVDEDSQISASKIMPVLYDKPSNKRHIGNVKAVANTNKFQIYWNDTKGFSPANYTLEIYRITSGATQQSDGSYKVTNLSSAVIDSIYEDGYVENWCVAKKVSVSN